MELKNEEERFVWAIVYAGAEASKGEDDSDVDSETLGARADAGVRQFRRRLPSSEPPAASAPPSPFYFNRE